MRPVAVALMLAGLSACSPDSEEAASTPEVTSATGDGTERPAFPPAKTIVGEYRVAGIDGESIDQPYAIALSITADKISFAPECAGFVWTYNYSHDGTLSTARHPDHGGETAPDGSTVVCAVGLKPTDIPLSQAIDAATRAGRTPQNAIELSGGGRSVTLFSQ